MDRNIPDHRPSDTHHPYLRPASTIPAGPRYRGNWRPNISASNVARLIRKVRGAISEITAHISLTPARNNEEKTAPTANNVLARLTELGNTLPCPSPPSWCLPCQFYNTHEISSLFATTASYAHRSSIK